VWQAVVAYLKLVFPNVPGVTEIRKQRKPSIAVVAVPARLRPGHLTNAHNKRHGLTQFTRFLAPAEIEVSLRRSQQLFVPSRNLQLDILRFIQVYSTYYL